MPDETSPHDLVQLNLGCGLDIRDGFVNSDIAALPGVDVVHDLDIGPWPWKDGSVSYIKASHVFEHVSDPVLFMTEAWRVLAADGSIDIACPFYQHPNSYTDPTHRRHCTEHTWDYWTAGQGLHKVYGLGMGSPPAVYSCVHVSLNGREREEIQVILRKLAGDAET